MQSCDGFAYGADLGGCQPKFTTGEVDRFGQALSTPTPHIAFSLKRVVILRDIHEVCDSGLISTGDFIVLSLLLFDLPQKITDDLLRFIELLLLFDRIVLDDRRREP